MAKVYQRKKSNEFYLPENLYASMTYAVKEYERQKVEYYKSTTQTENKYKLIHATAQALEIIPIEYRHDIIENISVNKPYPKNVPSAIYGKWKALLLYTIAYKLNLV